MSAVLRHVVDSISPASPAHAEGAFLRVAAAASPLLDRIARTLAGAQHTPAPRAARRTLVVAAGDHGAGDPGIALGADHPTVVAARAIDAGTAALAQVARSARMPIILVDAGVAEPAHLPRVAIRVLETARPTRDLAREPAMTIVDATLALEAGIALGVSLAENGLDVLALGALGVGAEVSAAALVGAYTGLPLTDLGDPLAELAAVRGAERSRTKPSGLELLAELGGPETGILAGAILAAASMNIPTILDGYATGAAALVAARIAPDIRGYLIAAHAGTFVHPRILAALALAPIFEVGLGHGEGIGAAMVVPLLDQVAALVATG